MIPHAYNRFSPIFFHVIKMPTKHITLKEQRGYQSNNQVRVKILYESFKMSKYERHLIQSNSLLLLLAGILHHMALQVQPFF